MRSLLEQLDSNESILLMYLADELPAADRVEIDKRLAADESLRAQLETLQKAQQSMTEGFAALDASQQLSETATAATQRQISRAIRQWHADRLRAQAQQPIRIPAWRRFGWAYPWAAAAVLAIGYVVWWGTQPANDQLPGDPGLAIVTDDNRPPSTQDVIGDLETPVLAAAERELDTVSFLREMTATQ
jgi:anti-sigma factor RsiW